MTLGRQLAAVISGIFLLALVGVQVLHLRGVQASLQRQLESTAQDAATSLGLALGVLLREADPVLAETVINPVFDRGHYARVEFVSSSGAPVVTRRLSVEEGDYPAWLVHLFALQAPSAESLVSAGWRQLGRVRVTAHPRFAYEQLWTTARDTSLWLLGIYALALGVVRLFLIGLLRPLEAVERAALEIAGRRFVTLPLRPATRELARVVDAMNTLSLKVNEAIETEKRRAERLQALAHRDAVTALPNAAGLAARFDTLYGAEHGYFSGAVALVQLEGLASLDAALGSERCNALLHELGARLEARAAETGGFAGRWRGALFVAVLPNALGAEARARLAALREHAALALAALGRFERISLGAALSQAAPATLDRLVSAAAEALAGAAAAADGVALVERGDEAARRSSLAAEVEGALAERRLELVAQPVFGYAERGVLHAEVMARLRTAAGTAIPAGEFMPVVVAQGLGAALDRAVLERVLEAAAGSAGTIAVNLAIRSLEDEGFLAWLAGALERAPQVAARLVFEVPEHALLQNPERAAAFAQLAVAAGTRFAIDHFGLHRESLALLQRLHPAYVKLAGALTPGLLAEPGTRFFAEALVAAANRLDVPVIAQNVEDAAALEALGELGFAGYQGNAAARPAAWPSREAR